MDALMAALEITGKGMLGIFSASSVIALAVSLMGKLHK